MHFAKAILDATSGAKQSSLEHDVTTRASLTHGDVDPQQNSRFRLAGPYWRCACVEEVLEGSAGQIRVDHYQGFRAKSRVLNRILPGLMLRDVESVAGLREKLGFDCGSGLVAGTLQTATTVRAAQVPIRAIPSCNTPSRSVSLARAASNSRTVFAGRT